MIISRLGEYELDDERARVDLDALWALLVREAYWGRFRTRDVLERQVARSWRVLGAYRSGALVGFARVVADGESLGYLADVVVARAHRRHGLGRALARELVESGPAAGWRWMLHTRDAHSLYADLGFRPPDGTYLERPRRSAPDEMGELSEQAGLVVVATCEIPADGVEAFRAYEDAVLPLLREHDGRLERRLRDADGTYEVHVLRFGSPAAFESYRSDPRRAAHAHLLAQSGAVVRARQVSEVAIA